MLVEGLIFFFGNIGNKASIHPGTITRNYVHTFIYSFTARGNIVNVFEQRKGSRVPKETHIDTGRIFITLYIVTIIPK